MALPTKAPPQGRRKLPELDNEIGKAHGFMGSHRAKPESSTEPDVVMSEHHELRRSTPLNTCFEIQFDKPQMAGAGSDMTSLLGVHEMKWKKREVRLGKQKSSAQGTDRVQEQAMEGDLIFPCPEEEHLTDESGNPAGLAELKMKTAAVTKKAALAYDEKHQITSVTSGCEKESSHEPGKLATGLQTTPGFYLEHRYGQAAFPCLLNTESLRSNGEDEMDHAHHVYRIESQTNSVVPDDWEDLVRRQSETAAPELIEAAVSPLPLLSKKKRPGKNKRKQQKVAKERQASEGVVPKHWEDVVLERIRITAPELIKVAVPAVRPYLSKSERIRSKREQRGAAEQPDISEGQAEEEHRTLGRGTAREHRAFLSYLSKTQVISALLGNEERAADDDVFADQIIKGIRNRLVEFPDLILQGRGVESTRIDYSPKAKDVTSISARIWHAQTADCTDEQIDDILKPLVAWNRWAFLEISGKLARKCTLGDPRRYQSYLRHHSRCLEKLLPITWWKRSEIAGAVFRSVRQRCITVSPESHLLLAPDDAGHDGKVLQRLIEWSLFEETAGLGAKLIKCFEEPGRTSEEYEDLIETCLYEFNMKNKEAIYGPALGRTLTEVGMK